MAKSDIWMPVYIGDYLADTMHLSTAEHGAYFLLLLAYWKNGAPLPDDDRKLSSICRVSQSDWPAYRSAMAEFFEITSGVWRNKRADLEISRAVGSTEDKGYAAALVNFKRWKTPIPPQYAERYAERYAARTQSDTRVISLVTSEANLPSQSQSYPKEKDQEQHKISQAEINRAQEVAARYPAQAKDGRPISFSLHAQNLLASKIKKDPDYEWEEHANLMSLVPMPVDGLKWVEGLPNRLDLSKLRQSAPAARKVRKEEFYIPDSLQDDVEAEND